MGKTVSHVILGMKTAKGGKQLKLDPTIYDALQKEKVLPGDVIYIEANSGTVYNALLLRDSGALHAPTHAVMLLAMYHSDWKMLTTCINPAGCVRGGEARRPM